MAILAVFNNAVALAEEIEARTSALQAIKEGRYPVFQNGEVLASPDKVDEPKPADPVTPAAPVALAPPNVVAPVTPVVPTV
ncbi:hypothetical protein vBAspABolek_44 [Aeromonas phage vB_AspA_Bolek]|nr:hypothetical protein vBAspABolek_44 [Aeromonas phage vB_AspA_Bolek]